jgi:CRP/FNR family transcriptional regulator, cyclic AMP receptor protein
MERRQAESFLRGVTWLAEAPADFQDQVLAKCDMLWFGKSDLVYDARDEASGLFGVVEGRLDVHLPALGIESTLSYVGGPGSWYGDIAAVTGQRRKIAIIAGSDCQLLRLPRREIARMTNSDPIVWRYFLFLLARNYAKAMNVVAALKQSDPVGRVAFMLFILSEDSLDGSGIGVSQSDLAELTHLGRSKVNASLKALEAGGHIRRRYGSIEVTNAMGLRDFISGPGSRSR